MTTTSNSLRRAAILVSTLDQASADRLLDQLPPDQADRIRSAIMSLDDFSDDEQQRIAADFLGRSDARATVSSESDVELELSSTAQSRSDSFIPRSQDDARYSEPSSPSRSQPVQDDAPLKFLEEIDPALVAQVLVREHPQTLAVVIASLSAAAAAKVLEQLPPAVSTETLHRMAFLHDMSAEVVADLARELRKQLDAHPAGVRPAAKNAVLAVIDALHGSRRRHLVDELASRDARLVKQLGLGKTEAPQAGRSAEQHESVDRSDSRRTVTTNTSVPRKRLSIEFDQLTNLDDAGLKRVLSEVAPRTAMLALSVAEPALIKRILKQLPARDAAALSRELDSPGPVRLRELEAAQYEVAAIADDLIRRGELTLRQQLRQR